MAVEAVYANYQNNPRGDRAPDSLYWLGQALMKLDKPQEACKVYGELTDVYGAKMSATLKDQAAKARVAAKCAACRGPAFTRGCRGAERRDRRGEACSCGVWRAGKPRA